VADLHRVAIGQPARGREGLGRRKAELPRLCCQSVDPELVAGVRADDGQAQLTRQRASAAGVVDVRVSRICLSSTPSRATAARSRGRSPPGSTTAASRVWSHQRIEQFCWKGVTGTVR
jgi:hypothetical protein